MQTSQIGSSAEHLVCSYYTARGFFLLAENFTSWNGKQVGEIDLVFGGPGTSPHVRFVEVKARSSRAAALSIDMLLPRFKRCRIAKTARYYMYSHPEYSGCFWHFNLAVVLIDPGHVFDKSRGNITIVSDVKVD